MLGRAHVGERLQKAAGHGVAVVQDLRFGDVDAGGGVQLCCIQLAVHGQRRVAQALGQSVAACVQQARHLGNMPKVAVQLEDAGHRHRQVARKGCACRTQQHNAQRAGHGAHQCRHRGLDAFHNGHHGHAPG